MLRRWCEALGQEYQRGRLGARDLSEAAKAKREVPGAAERQKTLAAQDGKRALCGCGLQTLQALCGDCHSKKTLQESASPPALRA